MCCIWVMAIGTPPLPSLSKLKTLKNLGFCQDLLQNFGTMSHTFLGVLCSRYRFLNPAPPPLKDTKIKNVQYSSTVLLILVKCNYRKMLFQEPCKCRNQVRKYANLGRCQDDAIKEPCNYRNQVQILLNVHSVEYIYVHKQSTFYSIVNIGSMKIQEDAIIGNMYLH